MLIWLPGRVTITATWLSSHLVRSVRLLPPLPMRLTRYAHSHTPCQSKDLMSMFRMPPMLPKPNSPQPTPSVWAWPSTSPSSTTKSSTPPIVHATLPSRLSMMQSPSSTLSLRSLIVTLRSSCNSSVTILLSGPPRTAQRLKPHPLRHPRRLRRLLSPRQQRKPSQRKPRPPPNLRFSLSRISSSRFHMLLELAGVAGRAGLLVE